MDTRYSGLERRTDDTPSPASGHEDHNASDDRDRRRLSPDQPRTDQQQYSVHQLHLQGNLASRLFRANSLDGVDNSSGLDNSAHTSIIQPSGSSSHISSATQYGPPSSASTSSSSTRNPRNSDISDEYNERWRDREERSTSLPELWHHGVPASSALLLEDLNEPLSGSILPFLPARPSSQRHAQQQLQLQQQLASIEHRRHLTVDFDQRSARSVETLETLDDAADSYVEINEQEMSEFSVPKMPTEAKGRTWNELVEGLLKYSTSTDLVFVDRFLLLYRKFSTPRDLVGEIVQWFELYSTPPNDDYIVANHCLRIFRRYISAYAGDFTDSETRSLLDSLLEKVQSHPTLSYRYAELEALVSHANSVESDPEINWAMKGTILGLPNISDTKLADAADFSRQHIVFLPKHRSISGPSGNGGNSGSPSRSDTPTEDTANRSSTSSTYPSTPSPARQLQLQPHAPTTPLQPTSPSRPKHLSMSPLPATLSRLSLAALRHRSDSEYSRRREANSHSKMFDHYEPIRLTVFFDISADTFASELTNLEWGYYSRITARLILRYIWGSEAKMNPDNSLSQMIAFFSKVSTWVAATILDSPKKRVRAKVMVRFMEIASRLSELHNYNSLMAVLAGVNNAAILRLNSTRRIIKETPIYKDFLKLEALMRSERSFAAYRKAFQAAGRQKIPYLGIHLRDFVGISEGNRSLIDSNTINWTKFDMIGEHISTSLDPQQYPFKLQSDQMASRLIRESPDITADVCLIRLSKLTTRTYTRAVLCWKNVDR